MCLFSDTHRRLFVQTRIKQFNEFICGLSFLTDCTVHAGPGRDGPHILKSAAHALRDSDSALLGRINGRIGSSVGEVTLGDSSANGGLSPQGTEVQTDYMPLLNSLAAYGWQLTCVLPTPILKTNR